MPLHCAVMNCVLYSTVLCCILPNRTLGYCNVQPYYNVLYWMNYTVEYTTSAIYCTALCCIELFCTLLYYNVLYSTTFYSTIMYCTVRAVLCSTALYTRAAIWCTNQL